MLTQKRLRTVLSYDPETGAFTWNQGFRKGTTVGTLHDGRGFLKVSIDGQRYLLHRLAWLWMTGAMPTSNIKHLDGNRSNNRWCNLRLGDRMQKSSHRGPRRNETSIPGVWEVGDKFEATVGVDGLILSLGEFETARAAQDAIIRAIRRGQESQRRKRPNAAVI
ncbi:HNH endonuclease [Pseudorhodobacter turbinis]|uniref:HNH endonuclease n=1 Tax=Pseudorhodobacter turbinis TaxID=2500533 RepID=A0A4P8EH81_9RHOB|nr:HNH endonuclease [Pseudorhodobacter turbinis]QCO56286.1 HNH endonuclease [Pseudorhodobacter turbinis]